MTNRTRLVDLAHQFIAEILRPDDIVVDATAGNGHDTLFLANLVGRNGHVFAFDIQHTAIDNSTRLLAYNNLLDRVSFIRDDHANIENHLLNNSVRTIKAAMFNLGYLPGGDKSLTTQLPSTITALHQCKNLLANQGRISIISYTGHTGGDVEYQGILQFFNQLDTQKFRMMHHYIMANKIELKKSPPQLFLIDRIN